MEEAVLLKESSEVWQRLPVEAWREAFNSHPRIGEQSTEGDATDASLRMSKEEQAVALASIARSDAAKRELRQANTRYEERFGQIFIVCASGRSDDEILRALEVRMSNDQATELLVAAEQQRQITELRLKRWMEGR